MNAIKVCGKALPLLWSFLAPRGIRLCEVQLKSIFRMYTGPFETSHGLTKNNLKYL